MYPAIIRLTSDGYWALYAGDGSDADAELLALGPAFEPGAAILDAVADLEAWAVKYGYTLVTPAFGGDDVPLDALITPDEDANACEAGDD